MKTSTKYFTALCLFAMPFFVAAQAPANDDPCNATLLSVGVSCAFTTYSNANSTASAVTNPGCANYTGEDVWFKAVIPASGAITFDSNVGNINDGGMAVYSGSSCSSLTFLVCNDDGSSNGFMPLISVSGLTPNDTLWVRFWEYNGGTTGTFGLCAWSVGISIPEYSSAGDMLIYPNPVQEMFTVHSLQAGINGIAIYDVFGKLVFQKTADGKSYTSIRHETVTMSEASGIYFYRITTDDDKIHRGKIIVE